MSHQQNRGYALVQMSVEQHREKYGKGPRPASDFTRAIADLLAAAKHCHNLDADAARDMLTSARLLAEL